MKKEVDVLVVGAGRCSLNLSASEPRNFAPGELRKRVGHTTTPVLPIV